MSEPVYGKVPVESVVSDDVNTSDVNCTVCCVPLLVSLRQLVNRVRILLCGRRTDQSNKQSPVSPLSLVASRNIKSPDRSNQIRNIYRRPVSRNNTRPRGNSYNYKQKQIEMTICSQRSADVGSQTLSDDWDEEDSYLPIEYEFRRSTMAADSRPNRREIKQNSLKLQTRPRACSMPPLPQSILKQRQAVLAARTLSQKRACFKENDVDVCYLANETPNQGPGWHSTSPLLPHNVGGRARQVWSTSSYDSTKSIDNRIDNSSSSLNTVSVSENSKSLPNNQNVLSVNSTQQPTDNYYMNFTHTPDDTFCLTQRKVVHSVDSQGNRGKCLLLEIETKGKFTTESTSVKLLDCGRALVVCVVPDTSQNNLRTEIVKKVPLPVCIDSGNMKVNIHQERFLTIVAPVVEN